MTPMYSVPSNQMMIVPSAECEFWKETFIAAFGMEFGPTEEGKIADAEAMVATAAFAADLAIAQLRKRFPPPPPICFPPVSRIGVEQLVNAQTELEGAESELAAIKELCDQMPENLGKAYFGVAGVAAENRVKHAQEWVANVQREIEAQKSEVHE